MNLYEYQRSRSFIDLGPMSLRFTFSNFFSLETAKSIEAKFQVEPPWDGGMKVYSNGPDHMTSMAAMPIFGKNLKIFFSGTKQPMTLNVGMQHRVLEYYTVQMMTWVDLDLHCILRQGQIWSLMLLYGKKVT